MDLPHRCEVCARRIDQPGDVCTRCRYPLTVHYVHAAWVEGRNGLPEPDPAVTMWRGGDPTALRGVLLPVDHRTVEELPSLPVASMFDRSRRRPALTTEDPTLRVRFGG